MPCWGQVWQRPCRRSGAATRRVFVRGCKNRSVRAFYFFVKPDSLRFVRILVGLAGHVPVRRALA